MNTKILKQKILTELLTNDEWERVKLGEVCEYGKCKTVKNSDITDDAWILDLEDIEKDTGKLLQRTLKAEKNTTSARHFFKKNDVLYSKLRTYLNKVLVADIDGFCTTEIIPIDFKGKVIPEFGRYVLMSPMFLEYTEQCGYGVKMPRFGTNDAKKADFPLPPLPVQKSIVAQIERLFAEIDRIETARQNLLQAVKMAKQKILQLAINGELVKCDEWNPLELKNVCEVKMGQSPDGQSVSSENSGIEFHQGKICFTEKFLRKSDIYTNQPTKIADANSLLLCVRAPVGVVNITERKICIGRGLSSITAKENIDLMFVYYWLQTKEQYFNEKATGTTFKAISGDIIKNSIIPIPHKDNKPDIGIQREIVKKIEDLFAQLEIIEKTISK